MGTRGNEEARRRIRGVGLATATAFATCLASACIPVLSVSADAPCPPIDAQNHLPTNLSYEVPTGYVDTSYRSGPNADLMAPGPGHVLEDIRFLPNDPVTDVRGHIQITVAGLPAYVINDIHNPVSGLYAKDVVLACGAGIQFLVDCRGSPGYDSALMTSGCNTLLQSLAFPAAAPPGAPCPSIVPQRASTTTMACSVPTGYHVVSRAPPQSITLTAPQVGSMRERIILNYNPPTISWQLAGATRITVNGCPSYVLTESTSPAEFLKQVVLLCGYHSPYDNQYAVQCRGYAGYDPALAETGCDSFIASLHTVSVPPLTPAAVPTSTGTAMVPLAPYTPVFVALVMGVWVWVIIRFLSWVWPMLAGLRRALWRFLLGTAVGRVLVFILVVATVLNVATHVLVLGRVLGILALVFWPILAVALVLEIFWRLIRRPLGVVAARSSGLPPPPPPPPPPSPPPPPPLYFR